IRDDLVTGVQTCALPISLVNNGAKDVFAYITHGVLSGGAAARIANSRLKELVITDSIQATEAVSSAKNIRVLSIASLIAEAIGRSEERRVGKARRVRSAG